MEIEIDKLGKRFQQGWVFQNLSYRFKSDNVYGISGRNGSGKSTFLKIISGLLSPSTGSLTYLNHSTRIKREAIYAHVSVAAPYTDLIEEYNLPEMIAFHSGLKPSDRLLSVKDWLEMMDFSGMLTRPIYQFSSGMKQRVKLGLALHSRAEIIILDEPTSNLDENSKAWFFDQLNKCKENKIILIASNEASDFRYCEEILPMN
ncbi:MAG: ATP-binding cassette domain-containing protein [Saprospiraceae bacterium]